MLLIPPLKHFPPLLSYLKYFTAAKGVHGIHSPFVFKLYNEVIDNSDKFSFEGIAEQYRRRLLSDISTIAVIDFGAGSRVLGKKNRRISDIAAVSAKPPHQAQMLARLALFLQPDNILEMGTSLGVSTVYLSLACPASCITTIEGSESVQHRAEREMQALGLGNVRSVCAVFKDFLRGKGDMLSTCGLVILDGHHQCEATVEYFEEIFPQLPQGACMVIEDIRWSGDMAKAWKKIIKESTPKVVVDLGQVGYLFKRDGQASQYFALRS